VRRATLNCAATATGSGALAAVLAGLVDQLELAELALAEAGATPLTVTARLR